MSEQKQVLKPRHYGGRVMTPDEVMALGDDELNIQVAVCFMGAGWHKADYSDGRGWSEERILLMPSGTAYGTPTARPEKLPKGWDMLTPAYHADIAAAFKIDRDDWVWEMEDYANHLDVSVYVRDYEGAIQRLSKHGTYSVAHPGKVRPHEYARARCIAALLIALEIGE